MTALEEERHGHVAVLRLNRPERANSLSRELIAAIGRSLRSLGDDDSVRVLVLTGAGEKIFCAGMDLKEFAEGGTGDGGDTAGEGASGLDLLMREIYPKPVIAAVNGAAVGGGFELALACDLIVAADHARFGLPEASRGLVAAGGGTALPKRLPIALALELALTGDPMPATRALELGLVNRVVPAATLLDEALALAGRIARNGPLALAATKRLMWEAIGPPDWARIHSLVAPVFASEDAIEGATAFSERREPQWKGR